MKKFPKRLRLSTALKGVLDESRVVIALREATALTEAQRIAAELKLEIETGSGREQINNNDYRYWLRSTDQSPIEEKTLDRIEEELGGKAVWLGPVYSDAQAAVSRHRFCPIPSVVLIRKARKGDSAKLIKTLGLRIHKLKSKYLTSWNYFEVENVRKANAFEISESLKKRGVEARFEYMPMCKPLAAAIPNDPYFDRQWNMRHIHAPDGWDLTQGSADVVICILDEGCDLEHPDLRYSEPGIDLHTMMSSGRGTGIHGTNCAGIAAAIFSNNTGIAGVAGNCRIMPIAFNVMSNWERAAGINYATTNGADVISMSFGGINGDGFIEEEIQKAFEHNVVLCAASGNFNGYEAAFGLTGIHYPATNPYVMACGAITEDDNRKIPQDVEDWGSCFGDIELVHFRAGISVVAPGVHCMTTMRLGLQGLGFGPRYDIGGYDTEFDGTSAATPHVAGLSALLKTRYPSLTNVQIRDVIERTAVKVGTLPYFEKPNFPNGSRNEELGYGRIDVFQALDFADVMIRDYPGDDGSEPSSPPSGNFWESSDIAVSLEQTVDDTIFISPDASALMPGKTNFVFVRAFNIGPAEARNVTVDIRIAPYVGWQSTHPKDWTAPGVMHAIPTVITNRFASIPAGGSAIAVFSISSAQVNKVVRDTESLNRSESFRVPPHLDQAIYQPAVLAWVVSDNDYAFDSSDFSSGNLITKKNNFAQKSLSIAEFILLDRDSPEFPLNELAQVERGLLRFKSNSIRLRFDKTRLPARARVWLGVAGLKVKKLKGGELLVEGKTRSVRIKSSKAEIELDGTKKSMALSLRVDFPRNSKPGDYRLVVSQANERNEVIAGATKIYRVK